MAEVGILDAIHDQIDLERGKILDAASEKAKAILKQAQAEVELLNASVASAKVSQQENVRVSPLILKARQDGMNKAFAQAVAQLSQLRNKPEYSTILKKLLQEAVAGMSGEMEILVNTADVELAKKIAAELQVAGKVTGTTDFDGGVSVVIDGNCINHNSFVSRVAKIQTLQSGKVASILYA